MHILRELTSQDFKLRVEEKTASYQYVCITLYSEFDVKPEIHFTIDSTYSLKISPFF